MKYFDLITSNGNGITAVSIIEPPAHLTLVRRPLTQSVVNCHKSKFLEQIQAL